jgi:hypothetical protein
MVRILNKNLFITVETHTYLLSIFRLRDMNNSDFNILDYQSFNMKTSGIAGSE